MSIAESAKTVFEITARGTVASAGSSTKEIANVFHYRRLATAVDVDKAALALEFENSMLSVIVSAMNVRVNWHDIGVRCVNDWQDPEYISSVTVPGEVMGDSLSGYACVTIRMKTSIRGRSGTGRKHFSPASEADIGGDVLTGNGLTNWQAVRDAMDDRLTDTTGNVWQPCVLSRKMSTLTNPTTIVTNDVTACVLNKTMGTMRRRKVATVV